MTTSNDVLVSDALLEDKFVIICRIIHVCTMSGRLIFKTEICESRPWKAIGEQLDHTITYFENVMQVPIFINPGYRFATCQMELRELKTFLNMIS